MVRVSAPCRLHFGLLSLPAPPPLPKGGTGGVAPATTHWPETIPMRLFGGVGLMIDSPRICVRALPSENWSVTGPSGERALGFGRVISEAISSLPQRFSIAIEECPPEHIGLGVGTALALATAKAIAAQTGNAHWSSLELAVRVGRGQRSSVGVHGFDRGGLIVEAGKREEERLAPLVGRYEFPAKWRVLLINSSGEGNWHGAREREAFSRLSNNATESLCRIVLTGLLPALVGEDLAAFGESLYEYNRRAGEGFAAVQGGAWANSKVANVIAWLRGEGVRGVGQSSWGPTVFAIVADGDEAYRLKERLVRALSLASSAIAITRGANRGAIVESDA